MQGLLPRTLTRRGFTTLAAAALLLAAAPADANPSMRAIALVTAGLLGWTATHPGLTATGNAGDSFSIGAFDRIDRIKQTLDVEYQHHWGHYLLWRFKPFAGAGVTGRRSLYAFSGLDLRIHFAPHLLVVPSEALALYFHGGGKRLGSPLEFRSGVTVQWVFKGGVAIGLGYHHISHWFLFGPSNPGTEILNLTVSVPLSE